MGLFYKSFTSGFILRVILYFSVTYFVFGFLTWEADVAAWGSFERGFFRLVLLITVVVAASQAKKEAQLRTWEIFEKKMEKYVHDLWNDTYREDAACKYEYMKKYLLENRIFLQHVKK